MTIREVILPEERAKVVEFLASFGLGYESNVEQTIYAEENDRIVGTVSSAGYVIKCLAVAQDMQSENLAEDIKKYKSQGLPRQTCSTIRCSPNRSISLCFKVWALRPLWKRTRFVFWKAATAT